MATYLDGFFIGFGSVSLTLIVWLLSDRGFSDVAQIPTAILMFCGIHLAVSCLYHVAFVGANGATPGKIFLKLEIVRADGEPLGYGLALLRWFAFAVNYATLMIGWMMAGWSTEKRGLHDTLCGTRVLDHGSYAGGPAGFWIRYVAKSLDGLVLSFMSFFISLPLGFMAATAGGDEIELAAQALNSIILVVISCAYFTYFVGSKGATLGKSVLGLKVIQMDGAPVPYGLAAGRWFASALNYLTLYVGWVMAAFTFQKRGLHDLICNTRVIHTK